MSPFIIDDPTPTTGGPHDYEFPDGCVCHIREDIDKGDQFIAPPEGCRVHTPWAFPGYSLTAESLAADFPPPAALVDVPLPFAGLGPCGPGCECRGGQ